jgi:hydrogenase maturation factor
MLIVNLDGGIVSFSSIERQMQEAGGRMEIWVLTGSTERKEGMTSVLTSDGMVITTSAFLIVRVPYAERGGKE